MPPLSSHAVPLSDPRPGDVLPSAVLFDMDGTLVDTEPYWIAAEIELVTAHGGTWTEDDALALIGSGLEDAAAVLQAAGADLGIREIVDRLLARVSARARERMIYKDGALELVAALREHGVPLALVTSSEKPLAEVVIEAFGGRGVFDVVVTGDLGHPAKPAPDPYLIGASRLTRAAGRALDPARMVAVEDSRTGIRSATAAGIFTLGVPNMVPVHDAGADLVLPTLAGLTPHELGRLVRGVTA
ncbi:haloacid dehalogenase [Kocuria dechangensis]|jgi:HAD superfamily hydrolase (TIGR01509 family)|uniref:Haloacid dehalogenase n=1 Tax=Kocuria dechangensis TaxID=1176249 RepID=A0A917H5S5_9MICC|nr:HAD family phosphatase [Kocuria dechangensis]GGG68430.1 haloacid dehalogenase [Kocuria dechangensis]